MIAQKISIDKVINKIKNEEYKAEEINILFGRYCNDIKYKSLLTALLTKPCYLNVKLKDGYTVFKRCHDALKGDQDFFFYTSEWDRHI